MSYEIYLHSFVFIDLRMRSFIVLWQERKFAIIDNVIISDSRCREKTSWHFMVAMLKRRLPTIDKLVSECATESVFGTHIRQQRYAYISFIFFLKTLIISNLKLLPSFANVVITQFSYLLSSVQFRSAISKRRCSCEAWLFFRENSTCSY